MMGKDDDARPTGARSSLPDPKFSVAHIDRSVPPGEDFYRYAAGHWLSTNPVPADRARWGAFDELLERNFDRLRTILEDAAARPDSDPGSPRGLVGGFFASALDTSWRQRRGIEPIRPELIRIDALRSVHEVPALLGALHRLGVDAGFVPPVIPDKRRSSAYAFYLFQGGLSLPDREYYLSDEFAEVRRHYLAHIDRTFALANLTNSEGAAAHVLGLETELARRSRTPVELRDEDRNYHRSTPDELARRHSHSQWPAYLDARGLSHLEYLVVGQPEFFDGLDQLLAERPLAEWTSYLRWQLLSSAAPFLTTELELEHFDFFQRRLRGQEIPEPAWRRAAVVVDQLLGEALGQLYVERYFPPDARAQMLEVVEDLRAVFRDRLARLSWMSETTRTQALAKFARFGLKIGHPDRFREYRSVVIDRTDYFGNVRRAAEFEVARRTQRVGGPVDRGEWDMTPPTVNAYYDPMRNEIVFPAGILQPPFFDASADLAINYGAIGAVIGHEITHGYDDQGRKFDAEGNLRDWWLPEDAAEFGRRAKRVVEQYSGYEALPGTFVNGELTLGENIADLGGLSIAYEALERRLSRDPTARRTVDGFTPEQRFFLAWAQAWRQNLRDAEARRRIAVDPHSPGRFRAVGAPANHPDFARAFGLAIGAPSVLAPEARAEIW